MSIIKTSIFTAIIALSLQSCNTTTKKEKADTKVEPVEQKMQFADTPEGKAKALIYSMEQVNGGWSHLLSKNDVEFTYVYHDYAKGKDISTERLIFQGETTFAKYTKHKVHVFPKQEGVVTQFLQDGNISATLAGKNISDKAHLGVSKFLREVNPFWFSMMYKLSDPSVQAKFEGVETVNDITYKKVTIGYTGTGKEADDSYILYFNPDTNLVDFFYFSLPAWGINEAILRMELKYEKIDEVLIATERTGFFPNPKTGELEEAGKFISTNIKFNNGFTTETITR